MKKEIPILFSTPMVQALLDGRKTMTRRTSALDKMNAEGFWIYSHNSLTGHVPYPAKKYDDGRPWWLFTPENSNSISWIHQCPYGKIGDILWVRETMCQNGELGLSYVADNENIDEAIIPDDYGPYGGSYSFRNIPNIHMPKWAARIWLEITDIKIERLQDITEEDAIAEGIKYNANTYPPVLYNYLTKRSIHGGFPSVSFATLWQSINGLESWGANPWVWVVKFKKINK